MKKDPIITICDKLELAAGSVSEMRSVLLESTLRVCCIINVAFT